VCKVFSVTVLGTCAGLACAEPGTDRGQSVLPDTSEAPRVSVRVAARCYRSAESVLLGPFITKSRQNGQGPGWLRIEGHPAADSGSGNLVDANRAGLGAFWRRGAGNSVTMTAANDFLRVELRLAVTDSAAIGTALAQSDADLEPDSAGQLRDFRREWVLRSSKAPCDSMPVAWTGES
jgi:hypothetical protein